MNKSAVRPILIALLLLLAAAALPAASAPVFWTEGASGPALIGAPPSFAPLAERAIPAVVTVYIKRTIQPKGMIFGPLVERGAGSGFIISSDGYILTSNHVVSQSETIKVNFGVDKKQEFDAKLVGADPDIDLALIKIDAKDLPVLPLGDSDKLRVGDWVACIGSPFNFPHTFTVGVVSARGRRLGIGNYDDFIQTDASINSGNSGGPMINMQGEAVGINTLIISPSGGNVGIGMSTPINLVKSVLPQLKEKGKVVRSWLGVSIEPVTDEIAKENGMAQAAGARVTKVMTGSPADKAGLEVGDIVTAFNGQPIKDPDHLPGIVSAFGAGREAQIGFIRKGQAMTRPITLAELPGRAELAKLEGRGEASPDNALGLSVRDTGDDEGGNGKGVVVTEVMPGSAAADNDIKPGDIVTRINLTDIRNINDFEKAVAGLRFGSLTRITLRRGNGTITRVFKLTRPAE